MELQRSLIGYVLCLLTCGAFGHRYNFVKNTSNYGECLLKGLECVDISQCPEIAQLVNKTTSVRHVLAKLKYFMCGLNNGLVKVCCPQDSVIPKPQPGVPDPATTTLPADTETRPPTSIVGHRNFNLINRNCGVGLTNRIVGGQSALPGEFPWLALLQYNVSGELEFLCGGSLITDMYVLTAAHCLAPTMNDSSTQLVAVRLGEYDLRREEDCPQNSSKTNRCSLRSRDYAVSEIVLHPRYNQQDRIQFKNDIALIRLKTRVELSEYVSPVCLPVPGRLTTKNDFLAGLNLTVAGWGMTGNSMESDVLMKVDVPYISRTLCEYNLRGRKVFPGQFCAGGLPAMNACNGDSGGPLIASISRNGGSRICYQVGIVSVGFASCLSSTPSIYTDVEDFVTWILDNIRD
ncbi:phenoloxidase-activating factor 3-like [Periplaneta americana]|uniref:phenoloxidase-activating factor 3-like n=1 Tax=Periplaneta americana TaxID=6978 RepID=UPI0037E8C412